MFFQLADLFGLGLTMHSHEWYQELVFLKEDHGRRDGYVAYRTRLAWVWPERDMVQDGAWQ